MTILRSLLLATAVVVASPAARGYEDGAPPGHTGGFGEPDCSACHSGNEKNTAAGRLAIEGLPDAYTPGTVYDLSVVLRHPELKSGGFQLAIRTADGQPAGELRPVSDLTRLVTAAGQSYLQHTRESRLPDHDGAISWRFQWRAPEGGEPLVVNIAANAANDDLSSLGDYIYNLEKKIWRNDNPGEHGDAGRRPGRPAS